MPRIVSAQSVCWDAILEVEFSLVCGGLLLAGLRVCKLDNSINELCGRALRLETREPELKRRRTPSIAGGPMRRVQPHGYPVDPWTKIVGH